MLAVHAGAYDIGTIRKGALDVVASKIDLGDVRVLAELVLPGWVYSSRKGLDSDVVSALSSAMFALNNDSGDHRQILQSAGMRGIIPPWTLIMIPCVNWLTSWD